MSDNPYKATQAEQQEHRGKPRSYGCLIASIVAAAILLLLLAGTMFMVEQVPLTPPPTPSAQP